MSKAYVTAVRRRIDVDRTAPIDATRDGASGVTRTGLQLLAGALLCLVAAGALLWWQQGSAVFATLVTGALAWCM